MFFDPADQPVCATEAVHDYHVTLFPAVVNSLKKCVYRPDCVTRVFEVARDCDAGAKNKRSIDLLTDTLLGHSQFNSVLLRVLSCKCPAECGLSRGPRAENHDESLHFFLPLYMRPPCLRLLTNASSFSMVLSHRSMFSR